MITSINIISENLPSLYATNGDTRIIDIESFFRKYRALLICVLGDELRSTHTAFTDKIKAELKANITNPSFFQANRKLRNNLHYEKTEVITEAEMDMIISNQPIYLSIIEKYFKAVINIDIDKECKIMTGFSKAYQASGISRNELERYYYFYYLKYRITGKL